MAKHQLSLDIPNTLNTCVLRLVDTSTYSGSLVTQAMTLDILVPGYTTPYTYYPETTAFNLSLTACDLGLQTLSCDMIRNSIPDGVYAIRYSVAPNEYVYVEYNHLRITAALELIQKILCCLDVPNCEPIQPLRDKLRELNILQTMLEAAKAKVEYCHNPSRGMDIYNYVMTRLKKLSCNCGCETC
jgi:hypothetical protein